MCFKIFKKTTNLIPTKKVQVTSNYIFDILNKITPSATHIYISDSLYWLCSKQDIDNFISQDDTNKMGYITEERDCDDFSYRLMGQLSIPDWSGIAFGIVWTNVHAFNCLIDESGKFYFVEPQSGKLYETIQPYMGNEILFILM
jgi:hypothetical protein